MSHFKDRTEIDAFAKTSLFYSVDPRVKLLCTIALIVVIALLTSLEAVILAGTFVLFLIAISKVPITHLARQFAMALIFILFAALSMLFYRGWENALIIGLRISVCVLALLLMVTTTPFFKMIKAMRWMHIPKLMASLLMFTYRFIFLLLDEMDRMRLARQARGFTGGRSLLDKRALRTVSNTIGMTFVRANARATNIYDALLMRGYSGEIRDFENLRMRPRDVAFAACFTLVVALTITIELGVMTWKL